MKIKLLSLFLFIVVLSGCGDGFHSDMYKLNHMDCPVVVVAKRDITSGGYSGAVVLIDGNGKFVSYSGYYPTGKAIISTYEVGDTIIRCKD